MTSGDTNHDGQIRYAITAAGKVEADRWLSSPVERAPQSRDELAMKLALAVTLPGVDAESIVNLQRLSALQNLQTLTTAKKNTDVGNAKDLAWVLVVDSQIFATEAEKMEKLLLVALLHIFRILSSFRCREKILLLISDKIKRN